MGQPLPGYADSFGAHRGSTFWHNGPASYQQMGNGSAPLDFTKGDTVQAVEAGIKFFDFVVAESVDGGLYTVQVIPAAANPSDGGNGAAGTTVKLRWVSIFSGNEPNNDTDLSGVTVRLFAIGRY